MCVWTKIRDTSRQQESLTSDHMARKTSPTHKPNKENLTQDTTNSGLCKGKRTWCCVFVFCLLKLKKQDTNSSILKAMCAGICALASVGECEKLKVTTHSTVCRLSRLLRTQVHSAHRRRHSSTSEKYARIMTWYSGDHSVLQHRTFVP